MNDNEIYLSKAFLLPFFSMTRIRIFLETYNAMEKFSLVTGNQSQGSLYKICPNMVLMAGKSTTIHSHKTKHELQKDQSLK